jgi:CubicO group peptidase (beta-lactamase class C family)
MLRRMESIEERIRHEGVEYHVGGVCDPALGALLERFCANFAGGLETGACLAVAQGGHPVADLWGGYADEARTRPWERDTLVNLQSLGKGIAAICVWMLVDQEVLDPDKPVAFYWPEFAAGGKEELPLEYLLDHRAGLAYTTSEEANGAIFEPGAVAEQLALQSPLWEPGTQAGYHAVTLGLMLIEIVHKVTGMTLGEYLQREVCEPLGVDYYFGVPQEALARCAQVKMPPGRGVREPGSVMEKIGAVWPPKVDENSAQYRRAELPSNNGHGNARAVAAIYSALLEGKLMRAQTLRRMTRERHHMKEIILGRQYHMASGVILNSPPVAYMGPNPRAFGHHGSGGAIGFADPDAGIAFAYGINRLNGSPAIGRRRDALVDAALSR